MKNERPNKEFIQQMLNDYQRRVYAATRNLSLAEIYWQPSQDANSIGFIFWHVARVEDRLVTWCIEGREEIWIRDNWHGKTKLPKEATGLDYSSQEVTHFPKISNTLLADYFEAVRSNTFKYLASAGGEWFDSVPERTPFPENTDATKHFKEFTIGRYFRQLISEENQHLGQISYIRGLQRGINN